MAPGAAVERLGTELFGGARATRYRLSRARDARMVVPEDSETARRAFGLRAWRATAAVGGLTGELVIDDATGALMKVDISGTFDAEQEGKRIQGSVEAHGFLTEVAITPPIERPPAEDLALRQRIVPEQRELLQFVRCLDVDAMAEIARAKQQPVETGEGGDGLDLFQAFR